VALAARLKQMKEAHIALIKEAFCRLPITQRFDVETRTFDLFALRPVSAATDKLAAAHTAPFGIIARLLGTPATVFEIFPCRSKVVLRRDLDLSLLLPFAENEAARVLPVDAQAYQHGTPPAANATCHAFVTPLDTDGAPFLYKVPLAVPDTFASERVNAIASTAVRHLFAAHEAQALREALLVPELEDAAACHEKWLAFYQKLSPPKS